MGLFNLFNKKQEEENFTALGGERDFISDLVDYFSSKDDVEAAFFGLVPLEGAEKPVLFLAVSHSGDDQAVQQITWMIKSTLLPEAEIQYASSRSHKEILEFISKYNFPFYNKSRDERLHQAIMRNHFEPVRFNNAFLNEVRNSEVAALIQKANGTDTSIAFQSYVREDKEFMPLFSSEEMIGASGMTEIPKDLDAIKFNFAQMNQMIGNGFDKKFFVLNPGTSFETPFYG